MGGKVQRGALTTRISIGSPRAAFAKSRRGVAQAWKRIESWLAEHAPPFHGALSAGASPYALARVEERMQRRLPPQLAESLLIHDGEGFFTPTGLIGGWSLMSAENIARVYCRKRKWIETGDFGDSRGEAHPAIRDAWWHTGWVPFVSSGSGHFFCIDTDPAESGKRGQVFLWLHDDGKRYLAARSLADWFSAIASDMEMGTYSYDEVNGFNHHAFMKSCEEGTELYDWMRR